MLHLEDIVLLTEHRVLVVGVDRSKIVAVTLTNFEWPQTTPAKKLQQTTTPAKVRNVEDDIQDLIARPSFKERELTRVGSDILSLLGKKSVKEQSVIDKFKSQGGPRVCEYCPYGTKEDCRRETLRNTICNKIHFRRIMKVHTDLSLGDCSYLDTCRHMKTCKFVHYEIDDSVDDAGSSLSSITVNQTENQNNPQMATQWINCDIRGFDFSLLGKFTVVMADPPWDIHMELPYGTLKDDEMRTLNVACLQGDGFLFLWVTGRAMELGRECMTLWGYERIAELVWVKTNQLQRIIRTGRTGHWLNHSKEHCLVGVKGSPKCNAVLDCDVIVAEVRETSRKPDEIYGIIERLSPGTRKLELFGRKHNIRPGWITLGNQLETTHILEPDLLARLKASRAIPQDQFA